MPFSAKPVFLTQDEAKQLRAVFEQDSLIGRSLRHELEKLEEQLCLPVSVPDSGAGGGVEHEQHKLNYNMIFSAGRFWMILGEPRYAEFIRKVLLMYVAKNFRNMPYAKPYSHNPPGKFFHQILNEHMWMLFTAAGYSCVRETFTEQERCRIDEELFAPMVEMFTKTYHDHFDIIHNHGMWASAAVGICGIACQRQDWLELAVYGQFGDSQTAGFLAQTAHLFSPSGYYEEGPYYQRFAIQPMLMFAEAIERAWPEAHIYKHHNEIIRRGFYAALYPSFPNGALVPLNDAIKPMSIQSLGYVLGASFIYRRYAADTRLLWLADQHQQVWLDAAGLVLSDAYQVVAGSKIECEFPSIELSCGVEGDQGAVGILRTHSEDGQQTVLTLDYGSHGLAEHSHFDGLTLGLFNRSQEVLRDYGCVRWINIEPKHGGAYLPENVTFAKQTIAHNTITVDEQTQHDGDADRAMLHHGTKLQFQSANLDAQMMSGEISHYTPGVVIRRSAALLRHEDFEHPLLIDLCTVKADDKHQYDYALNYIGQTIRCNFSYERTAQILPLGTTSGYQHLWNLGSAKRADGQGLFTWLQGNSYYSVIFATSEPSEFIFTRLGANDPNFNLREECGLILRQHGQNVTYATVLETHGFFQESTEASRNARGKVCCVKVIVQENNLYVLELQGQNQTWHVGMAIDADEKTLHQITLPDGLLSWQGAVCIKRA